jgi:hypothetical protein
VAGVPAGQKKLTGCWGGRVLLQPPSPEFQ